MTLRVQQDIGWLDVPMHYVTYVDKGHRLKSVVNYLHQMVLREIDLMFHQLVQICFDILHNDADLAQVDVLRFVGAAA
jgi:hypothetical protein